VVILQHFAGTVKAYLIAIHTRGHVFAVPGHCPHPDCQAVGLLIYWGFYERNAITEEAEYRILVQRVRCKACGRTHSLLPDFVHPHRSFALNWLQRVVFLYLLVGLGWTKLMADLEKQKKTDKPGPARSTVREWVDSFAYGAGELLLDLLTRCLLVLDPLAELPDTTPPEHLKRIPDPTRRGRLNRARCFWLLSEQLYALVKGRKPDLTFSSRYLFAFVLHWLQDQGLSPRLLWSPRLTTTPTTPF
jgi:hypothetical protein